METVGGGTFLAFSRKFPRNFVWGPQGLKLGQFGQGWLGSFGRARLRVAVFQKVEISKLYFIEGILNIKRNLLYAVLSFVLFFFEI